MLKIRIHKHKEWTFWIWIGKEKRDSVVSDDSGRYGAGDGYN